MLQRIRSTTSEAAKTPNRDLKVAAPDFAAYGIPTCFSGKAEMPDSRDALFSKLFAETYGALGRYVRRLVKSRETAEEIVQEAFLRTYQHAASDKAPRAFLYSIARNLATDHRRHARIAQTDTPGDFAVSGLVSQRESVEARLLADERSRLLKDAIDRLPQTGNKGVYLRQRLQDKLIEHKQYIEKFGEDMPEIRNWKWGVADAGKPA